MESQQVRLTPRHDFTPDEIDDLEERIYEYNAAKTGLRDAAQIGFTLESDGKLIGAAAGFTWGGMCELRQLWINEQHRGLGHGRRLVREVVEEARARECTHVYLSTYEFQGLRFYRHLGFQTVAAINGRPKGHLDTIMCLAIGDVRL